MVRSAGLFLTLLFAIAPAVAQTLYKYQNADGEWVYTDRKPPAEVLAETRKLESTFVQPTFVVRHDVVGTVIEFVADNEYHAPIEVRLKFEEIIGVSYPDPDNRMRWVVPARSEITLMTLNVLETAQSPSVEYGYQYLPGDPSARHSPPIAYQAPFSVGIRFPVTQAFPDTETHRTLDSQHAVDIAMPVGTDILAARDGVVFDVTSDNFKGGLDIEMTGDEANIIRILHDDGTFSLYAHLNWNSIRVKPGDKVKAGQYIADSGNTGFSSGPHLHFAVQRNTGMQIETVPVTFRGRNSGSFVPRSGESLVGYR